jgi:hypothetical protein
MEETTNAKKVAVVKPEGKDHIEDLILVRKYC